MLILIIMLMLMYINKFDLINNNELIVLDPNNEFLNETNAKTNTYVR